MTHKPALLAITAAALLPGSVNAEAWPHAEDIPAEEPVTVGLAGKQPADIVRYLLAQGAQTAELSPNGEQLAFTWAITGAPQLWLVDAAGGWPHQVTFGSAITFFRWSPDGRNLLVGRDAEGNEREGYYLISKDGNEERQMLPRSDAFRQFGMFSSDGARFVYSSTERNGRDFDIYVGYVETGETRQVLEGSFGFFPVSWQPNGDLLIVSETRGEDANNVHLLDIGTGKLEPLFEPEVAASYREFAWLPDGSGFYLSTNHDREFAGLAFYSLEQKELRFLHTPDHDIDDVALTGDASILAWTQNEDGWSRLHAVERSSGNDLELPDLPDGVFTLGDARRAAVLSILISSPGTPGDVWTWNPATGAHAVAVRSSLGGLSADNFVAPRSLRYEARDGVELQGLLYLPHGSQAAGETPPVVVYVHGGPTAQSRPSFAPSTQYLVNQGIAVFAVNVRGSTGFGKTYTRLDNREKRLDSVRDLVDTVAFLTRDGAVDTKRIAVMGGSYGGYMVNAVLGLYPGVFDAGVSMVGVSDWVRALQDASPALMASDRVEYGDIRDDEWQEFYRANSPINLVEEIQVPLLVQHGANDPRDPVSESDRFVTAIRDAGGSVEYLRFPDEGHSLTKESNRVIFYRRMADFLERNLKRERKDRRD